jgi:hypothetical protein
MPLMLSLAMCVLSRLALRAKVVVVAVPAPGGADWN